MLLLVFVLILFSFSFLYNIQIIDNYLVDYLIISIMTFTTFFYLSKKVEKSIFFILLLAFSMRMLVLLIDFYDIYPILHSGKDSEGMHNLVLRNIALGGIFSSRTNYTDILYYIYQLTESSRLIAQFLNLVFGFSSIFLLYKSLKLIRVSHIVIKQIIFLIAVFPNHIILSVILLREAWIFFFVAYSMYYAVQWIIVKQSNIYIIGTFTSVALASYMHAGIMFILIGYILLFTLYNPKKKKMQLSVKSSVMFFLSLIMIGFLVVFKDVFMGKFASLDSDDLDRVEALVTTKEAGDSAYLTWIEPTSVKNIILYTPLKLFFFLFSPLPFNWRGLFDVFAFVIDGLIYLFVFYRIIKNYRNVLYAKVIRLLLIGIFCSYIAFAWGTYNAGTAMRHRCKLFPLLLLLYGIQSIPKSKEVK